MIDSPNNTEQHKPPEERHSPERRAEQAAIVAGLTTLLEPDEQLLSFARGRIAGNWRDRLSVGPEAFFAPHVNIGLTERRFLMQHYHTESGRVSEIAPHIVRIAEIAAVSSGQMETFGGETETRLTLRLRSDLHIRLRISGVESVEDAKVICEVFASLTKTPTSAAQQSSSRCEACGNALDGLYRFCPYCGQPISAQAPQPAAAEAAPTGAPTPDPVSPEEEPSEGGEHAAESMERLEAPDPPGWVENGAEPRDDHPQPGESDGGHTEA